MTVLSPWRALERNDLSVTHWHGDVTLGSPLPSRFYHGGMDLLSGPVRMLVQLHLGSEQEITATPVLSSEGDEEITWTYSWDGTDVDATGTVTVHETGMVTCSVNLDPAGTKTFASVKLEIPLNPAICVFLRNGSPNGNSSSETPVPTWEDGQYVIPSTTSGNWKRFVSVANDELGLQWCFETDAHHISPEVIIDQSSGLATIHIITENKTTAATFSYEFTLSPLPCRPLVPDWVLSTRVGLSGTSPDRNWMSILSSDINEYIKYHGSLLPCELTEFNDKVAAWRGRNLKVGGYLSSQYWLDDADNGFDSDWENQSDPKYFYPYRLCGDPLEPPEYFRRVKFWLEDFQEYVLDRIDTEFSANHFDVLYFDVHNTQLKEVITDAFGSSVSQIPFALHRDWSKTLYARCENSNRRMLIHPQHLFNARCHAYSHYVCVGEELSTPITGGEFLTLEEFATPTTTNDAIRRRYYMNTLPIRYWRSVANSRVTGVAVYFLPELFRVGHDGLHDYDMAFASENCLAMCRLHGLNVWRANINGTPVDHLYDTEADFGLTNNSRFYGYWQSNCPATTEDSDAKVSVFREGNKLLVYVVNFADTDRGIDIEVPHATGAATKRFVGTGSGDGHRSTPYNPSNPSGTNGAYTVYVARENFASVEITLSATAAPVAAYHLRRQRCCR